MIGIWSSMLNGNNIKYNQKWKCAVRIYEKKCAEICHSGRGKKSKYKWDLVIWKSKCTVCPWSIFKIQITTFLPRFCGSNEWSKLRSIGKNSILLSQKAATCFACLANISMNRFFSFQLVVIKNIAYGMKAFKCFSQKSRVKWKIEFQKLKKDKRK